MERQSQELLIVEDKLTQQVSKYFNQLEKQVQKVVNDNQDLPADTVAVLVNVILEDMTTKYRKLLYKHLRMTEQLSKRHTKEIITLQQRKRLGQKRRATDNISFKDLPLTWLSMKAQTTLDNVLGMNVINPDAPYRIQQNKAVKEYLEQNAINASESTRARINKDIQKILTTSETEGIGNKEVAKKIREKFNDLKTWEARRIARTEINAANNLIAHQELLNDELVDYKMWVATSDNRTRDTHKELNSEITRIGNTFSNGLQYPGDHNGKISEFINCRCRVVAWIPDYDKIPPTSMEHFRESDCLPLPVDESKQVMLQLPEDVKLFEVREGYMKFQLEGWTVKPVNPFIPSLISRLLDENGEINVNINNPLRKVKPKFDEGRFRSIFKKMDDNNVTVHIGKNLEKPVFVQNGKEILKPAGINGTEIEEFEKLYSNILGNVLSSKEQKALDKLMNRLKKNGGYVRVSQDGRVQVNWRGKFTSKERNLLRDLQQKRIDVLMKNNIKPTLSTPVIPPKVKPKVKPKAKSAKPKPKEKLKPKITKPKTKSTQNPQTKLIGTHTKPPIHQKEVQKMSFEDLADYYEVEYKGLIKSDYDGKKYHTFVEQLPDSSTMEIKFEEAAVKSYTKAGIATPQEIIQEVLRIPKQHKIDTDRIWFKNTNQGIMKRPTKSGFDSLGADVGGYNTYYGVEKKGRRIIGGVVDAPHHEIVINPKYFKGAKGKYAEMWKTKEGHIENWKHAIRHEFTHSIDTSRQRFEDGVKRACYEQEYMDIEHDEKYFTSYANSAIHESYAEHGGYVSYMLDHPEDHAKTITISIIEDNKYVRKDINFEEYKEMFPKHYEYFRKLCLGE